MESGGGEPSQNGSHNAAADLAPATPSKPIPNLEVLIDQNYTEHTYKELIKFVESGALRFPVPAPPPPSPPPKSHEIPVPNQLPFDLNLTPEANFGASSLLPNTLNFTPVTPQKQTRSENTGLVEAACKESEKGSIATLENLAENPVDSLVAGTPGNLDNHDIDMISTPQPKQKRKKHRPKVVSVDKPKIRKTPASVDSKERPAVKRTYVRRNRKENGPETPENTQTGSVMKRSCNRVLNFDGAEVGFNDSGSQTIPLSNGSEDMKPCSVVGNDSDCRISLNLTEEMNKEKESQGHHGHSVEEPKNGAINLQPYYLVSWPNITRKRSAIKMTNVLTSSATVKNGRVSSLQMISEIFIDLSPNTRPTKKRTPNATKVRDLASLNRVVGKPKSCIEALKEETKAILSRKKQTTKKNPAASKYPSVGREAVRNMFSVDAVEEQLQCLDINKDNSVFQYRNAIVPSATIYDERNALVLYKSEGTVVPFEPIKKPRPRGKVDLDEETTRVWQLLLENINSEGVDGTDADKVKYWEEERRVFSERADSFIAKMHLVQGDRRFSRWKGSVLDSVVGVFLTQNVSDHLSSSAYMSLAARFPLKPRNDENAQDQVPNKAETGTKKTYESYTVEHCDEEEDKVAPSVISQQQNGDSPTSPTCEKTRSCSENNSDESAVMSENVDTTKSGAQDLLEVASMTSELDLKETCIDDVSQSLSLDPMDCQRLCEKVNTGMLVTKSFEILSENNGYDQISLTVELTGETLVKSQTTETSKHFQAVIHEKDRVLQENLPKSSDKHQKVMKDDIERGSSTTKESTKNGATTSKPTVMLGRKDTKDTRDWDELKRKAEAKGKRERNENAMNSLDWEAVRLAPVNDIAQTIKERGMNNRLAQRIQDFLNRLVNEHGSTDLEWLRDVPPDQAKEYLLSIRGLGLKSVECVRLLTLHHLAFPVDTNVGRIVVRLGWVPLQPLPESLQLHLLEMYPMMDTIQKYLWPRLCKLDQKTLYELHYQMITFGKVFCTKSKPNCNSCPLRGECKHFASAYASARLALPGPEDKSIVIATEKGREDTNCTDMNEKTPFNLPLPMFLPYPTEDPKQDQNSVATSRCDKCETIIEEPASPEPEYIRDIEDYPWDESDEIPTIKLNAEAFTENLHNYMQEHMESQDANMSKALVPLDPQAASIPMPKLKNVNRLRTEHQVYELPDHHVLLNMVQMEKREPDDPCPYLLAIWTPGETANSVVPPEKSCCSQGSDKLCNNNECFSCNSAKEANSQTVRGTFLIPCRTATRGSFPLNGTYFQVNEVFADNVTSNNPMEIPRHLIWNLRRRTVYFGTSVTSIFRGLTTEGIQLCFRRGFVCVRAFDRESRTPRGLKHRLHYAASRDKREKEMKAE